MVDDPATPGSDGPDPVTVSPPSPVPSPAPGPESGGWPSQWVVRRFATIDSTNRWLLDAARAGAPAGLVAVADHQDAGRGRRGRTWDDEPGSALLVSVLLRPAVPPERIHLVTMAAGVAIAEAVEATSGVVASLKWPNDLVVHGRKLAGLLAEVDLGAGDAAPAVVVGIGCNVTQTSFSGELTASATSCAIESNRSPGDPALTRDALLDAFLEHLDRHLGRLGAIPAIYRARLATLGRRVRVDLGDTVLEGVATDVDDAGRLVVDADDGGVVAVAAGDVVHLRHPDGSGRDAGDPGVER